MYVLLPLLKFHFMHHKNNIIRGTFNITQLAKLWKQHVTLAKVKPLVCQRRDYLSHLFINMSLSNASKGKLISCLVCLCWLTETIDTIWHEGSFLKLTYNKIDCRFFDLASAMYHELKCIVRYGGQRTSLLDWVGMKDHRTPKHNIRDYMAENQTDNSHR